MSSKTYVKMQLTQAGADLAQGGKLIISSLRGSLTFIAGASTDVESHLEFPWLQTHAVDGKFLFELVPGQPTLVPAAAPDAPTEQAPTEQAPATPEEHAQ